MTAPTAAEVAELVRQIEACKLLVVNYGSFSEFTGKCAIPTDLLAKSAAALAALQAATASLAQAQRDAAVPPPSLAAPIKHDWQPDGGLLKFESHPGTDVPHVHATCTQCKGRAWFTELQWEMLSKGCSEPRLGITNEANELLHKVVALSAHTGPDDTAANLKAWGEAMLKLETPAIGARLIEYAESWERSLAALSPQAAMNPANPERRSSLEHSEVKPDETERRSGEVDREIRRGNDGARSDAVGAGRTERGARSTGGEADEVASREGISVPSHTGTPEDCPIADCVAVCSFPDNCSAPSAIEPRRTEMKVTEEMVNRFLCWRLPSDFSPDCGINFDGRKPDQWNPNKGWPVGTNLLTATQARAMLEHVLGATDDGAKNV